MSVQVVQDYEKVKAVTYKRIEVIEKLNVV